MATELLLGCPLSKLRDSRNRRILQLLSIRQVVQCLKIERDQKPLGHNVGVRRPALRGPRTCPDQPTGMKPPDQVATDLLAEDVLEPIPRDRLVIADRSLSRD